MTEESPVLVSLALNQRKRPIAQYLSNKMTSNYT